MTVRVAGVLAIVVGLTLIITAWYKASQHEYHAAYVCMVYAVVADAVERRLAAKYRATP